MAQFQEKEVLTHDDYDLIIKLGWNGFRKKVKDRFNTGSEKRIIGWTRNQMEQPTYEIETWKGKGVRSLFGALTQSPLMTLSTTPRTLVEITKAICFMPDKLEAVMEAMLVDMIPDAIEADRISGEPGVMLVMERGSGFYYNLEVYERFEYPHMKKMVEEYCRKLIDVVGEGGGFILSTGCTCPVECKMNNLKAMVNTAKNYWPH